VLPELEREEGKQIELVEVIDQGQHARLKVDGRTKVVFVAEAAVSLDDYEGCDTEDERRKIERIVKEFARRGLWRPWRNGAQAQPSPQ
jgi:hypothetical protein